MGLVGVGFQFEREMVVVGQTSKAKFESELLGNRVAISLAML